MIQKLSQRFDQLESEVMDLETARTSTEGRYGKIEHVDEEKFSQWKVSAKHLIESACGESSQHLKAFIAAEESEVRADTSYKKLCRIRPTFIAAKDDFQGGYLISVKQLVQAEIFESELDQAVELLDSGYKGPGALVAGVVLETALRDLCSQNSIPHGKLDKMNADLAKAGIYNKLQEQLIRQSLLEKLVKIQSLSQHTANKINHFLRGGVVESSILTKLNQNAKLQA